MKSEILHEIENAADGVTVVVAKVQQGYSVTVRDDDAGEYVGTAHIFPTMDAATAKAEAVAAGREN